ncbi:MAG: ribonuclease R [Xenococcaceae cyanobacterium MO_167.B27]|nr:ribonuclease R [Xenococcaceae cyanobacterium MO_167.B27]
MEFSIATLLSQFVEDKLVAKKNLEKKLGCEDEESIQKLEIILDALEKISVLDKERGKYRRLYEEDVVEAKLRCSSKGFCFAIQDEENADDIYIRETHLSNAWNGDRVLVKTIKEGSRRRSPEGEVKLILERANPSLLATVSNTDNGYRAIPLDDRLLFELDLLENGTNLADAVEHLVHVSVARYPIAQKPPLGKVTKILGSDAEEASDVDIVSCKHDLPHEFKPNEIESSSSLPSRVAAAEIKRRLDLRDKLTIAIGSEAELTENSCIENALTLEQTSEGNWQLGIHIADVAHYIEQDTTLDRVARKRGTAINLQKKIIPLFPPKVNKICSLEPGKNRLTISILITINDQGEILESEIRPSVVSVDNYLTPQEVQNLLQEPDQVSDKLAPTAKVLNDLFLTLSPLVKAQRLQRGGFEITIPESNSLFQDEGRLGVILSPSNLPVSSLLTELMLLAGKVLAESLQAWGVPGIYCVQPEPDVDELEDLLKLSTNLGLELELDPEGDITPHDYQLLTQQFATSSETMVLNYLLQDTLKPVKYVTKPGKHFGLAYSDGYTHCISPGQRYIDLMVQRILKTVFEFGRDRRHSRAKNGVDLGSSSCYGEINWNVLPPAMQEQLDIELHAILPRLNDREKVAEDAESDLEGLKKAEKMKERTGKVFEGLIVGVQSYGFFVQIEDLLVEGLVHVSSLKDDWYEYRSRHSCLVGRKNRTAYRLGDRVEVEVKSVDYYRQQIDLVTQNEGFALSNGNWEEE